MTKRLEGPHPYGAAGEVGLEVPWSAGPPKNAVGRRCRAGIDKAGRSWFPLAGPFVVAAAAERALLLGLVWDLAGQPMLPGHPARHAARYLCAETEPGMVTVYRDMVEVQVEY